MQEKEESMENQSVYIVSADAKDLFLSNFSSPGSREHTVKQAGTDQSNQINLKRFVNTLDYSLDLIKLREVYKSVYRNNRFSFVQDGKEYCQRIINVTFKYSVKEFNRFFGNLYIKYGYLPQDIQLVDNAYVEDGELIAVKVGDPVSNPLPAEVLGKCFIYKDGAYQADDVKIKTVIKTSELRQRLYRDGFVCDGIRFVRYKRSSGSSRVGKCLFIDERLYPKMHKWELCGLKVREGQEIDLAAFEAYIALTLSSIIGTVPLQPENFLVIDDFESVFEDRVIATRIGRDGWLTAGPETTEITNNIWDGQSLIDKSAMGEYREFGMILLRNRFFKSACFNTNIQDFFKDHGITEVSQLAGFTLAKDVHEIKIITTPSSIKYLKFGPLEQWLKLLEEDGRFGVVKHEKPTHFFDGRMVQAHYQLLNTLQLSQEQVDRLVKPSLDYLQAIQNDPAVLRYHIHYAAESEDIGFANTTNDIVYRMLGVTDKFAQTKLYRTFVDETAKSFKKRLKSGHILIKGNYSTLLGNPIEMLYAAIGQFDGISKIGAGNIFCKRFEFGQTILGSRSPHVTMGNILLAMNADNAEIQRYMNTTPEIVCINSIGENILMRLSGSDFDSDSLLLTDNPLLIEAAQRNYHRFLVPTSMVEAKKAVRHYTQADQADLDVKTSVNKIGEIVNLSQELNTMLWDLVNNGAPFESIQELYCDIAKLDVLSNIEIDKAKKEFTVDSVAEIKMMRSKYRKKDEDKRNIKPKFLGHIARKKGYYDPEKNCYKSHETAMDYLQRSVNRYHSSYKKCSYIPFSALLIPRDENYDTHAVYRKQVYAVMKKIRSLREQIIEIKSNSEMEDDEKWAAIRAANDECAELIQSVSSPHTQYRLLLEIEKTENKDVSGFIFSALFAGNPGFINLIKSSRTPIRNIIKTSSNGDIELYSIPFIYETSKKPPNFSTNSETA